MKHYPKIKRLSSLKDLGTMFDNEYVEITEKIDGSNASFCLNELDNSKLDCFSRKTELNESSTLNGFYNWVNTNVLSEIDKLNPNYIYFGEWLVKHKINYDKECYYKFYLFDIYDRKRDKWLDTFEKEEEFDKLKNIKDIKKIKSIVTEGKKIIEKGYQFLDDFPDDIKINQSKEFEGVVVKIFNKLYNNEPCFFKIVNPKFEEIKRKPKVKSNNNNNNNFDCIGTICTKNRTDKIILKLLDEGVITNDDLYIENMNLLMKIIIPKVLEDILEEESDLIEEWKSEGFITDNKVGKSVGKITPKFIVKFIEGLD